MKVIYENMPTSIGGFVKEKDGFYTVVLNARMTRERNAETLLHELRHIENGDFEKESADQVERVAHEN